jgi:type VI secretion system secreted protein Hcp
VAVDMFLKFTPTVKGESKDSKHKDEIDILSFSWGASNSGTTHQGGGGGSGKANIQDLSVTKFTDLSSTSLHLACWNGKHLDEAVLYARKAGEKPLEYLTITMNEVLITSISTGGSGGEDRFTENVTLNFAKVKVEYKEQSDTGGAGASPQSKWNIAANAES